MRRTAHRPPLRLPARLGLGASVLVLAILAAATSAPAADSLGPIPWRSLEFGASDWLNDVSLTARWSPLSADARDQALIDIPNRAVLEPGSREIVLLAATVEARGRWSSTPKRWSGEIWFRPDDAVPLQRVRSKQGGKATRKLYRYATDGVYRVREESGARNVSFFAFQEPASRCAAVSDPALLLLLASSPDLAPGGRRRLCVFNKKGVYEVELRSAAGKTSTAQPVQFRRSAAPGSWETAAVDEEIRIEIVPQPLGGSSQVEAFEFFELRPPLSISLDPSTRLPIAIEGAIKGFGAVRFELVQVEEHAPVAAGEAGWRVGRSEERR